MARVVIREFRPEDVDALEPQESQAQTAQAVEDWRRMIRTAAACGPAWTALEGSRVLGVAGLGRHWPGRSEAWCMIARGVPKTAWLAIHRGVVRVLAEAGIRRVEAHARQGFDEGQRWLRLLGFYPEGVRVAYGPDGSDYVGWVRIRR